MIPTYDDAARALDAVGVTYAYVEWDQRDGATPPPLPYALLVPQSARDVRADGGSYLRVTEYDAEVYEDVGDTAHLTVERALDAAGCAPYQIYANALGHGVEEWVLTFACLGR